jgi:Ribonuclease G/E
MTAVRVRGIYATALTAALRDAGHEVVSASPPIRARFDADFPTAERDVRVATTGDRQGVEVSGPADGADAVGDALADLAVDTFRWAADAPRDAVFRGRVERTVSGGAVVALGDGAEGYLPFGRTDDHVTEGDALTVQVRDPAPPWDGDRPLLAADVQVTGGLATLERGVGALVAGTPRDADELAGLTEMLSADVPDDWGVRWERDAPDAAMDALDDALAAAADRARAVDDGLADPPDAPGLVAAPLDTEWVWFGREARAACDDLRADHATTMAGHHRVKAAASAASDAVDLLENVGDPPTAFPFGAVTETFGPVAGDAVAIGHGKPDGRCLSLGRGEVTDREPDDGSVTVRREMSAGGTYDALGVPKEAGDVAVTTFREGRWWYPTTYRDADGGVKGTYVNVCTPVEVFPDEVRYVDLHVDVLRHADGTVAVVDEDELAAAEEAGLVTPALAERARDVAEKIASGLD